MIRPKQAKAAVKGSQKTDIFEIYTTQSVDRPVDRQLVKLAVEDCRSTGLSDEKYRKSYQDFGRPIDRPIGQTMPTVQRLGRPIGRLFQGLNCNVSVCIFSHPRGISS